MLDTAKGYVVNTKALHGAEQAEFSGHNPEVIISAYRFKSAVLRYQNTEMKYKYICFKTWLTEQSETQV